MPNITVTELFVLADPRRITKQKTVHGKATIVAYVATVAVHHEKQLGESPRCSNSGITRQHHNVRDARTPNTNIHLGQVGVRSAEIGASLSGAHGLHDGRGFHRLGLLGSFQRCSAC